ncbi:MAG: BTAD domain-containing putative transcriptional regulator [Anaerolineae bacterium]
MTGRIRLFGTFQMVPGKAQAEIPLEIRSAKLQALLAYLILRRGEPVERRKLGNSLWPQAGQSSARRNLREYLYRARQVLARFAPGQELVRAGDGFVRFTPPPGCQIDVIQFEQLSQQASQDGLSAEQTISLLQQATALYRGDLLANLYDDWLLVERERLHILFTDNLAGLSQALQAQGRLRQAIAVTQRLLEDDPLRESAHRRLMELYYASGDRARALHQYQVCSQRLAAELGAKPLPETRALYRTIAQEDRSPAPLPAPPPETVRPVPFTGRQSELARLTQALLQSRAGRFKMIVVTGGSGMGKTRLVTEWLAGLPAEAVVLQGRGYEFEQDLPYRPLLDALQGSLPRVPWDRLPPASTYTWLAPLAQLLPDLYYYLPDLPATLAQTDSETSHHIMEGLAQLLLSFARQSQLVLFLDDLHWADVPTWQFLSFLNRRAGAASLLVVCSFSPPEASERGRARLRRLEQSGQASLLPLSRLWPADTARLVSQILGCPVDEIAALAMRLHQEADGNPFFITETGKALLERELVPPFAPEVLDQLPLPTAIEALVKNRLDRLGQDSRLALSTAAAIRRDFSFDLLVAISHVGDEETLLNYLEDWLARGLIVEQGGRRYEFGHQGVREVAYDSLSPPRQRRVHHRIARALESRHPVEIERVAYHYRLSDEPARALPALLEAGRRALNLRSYHEARNIGQTLLKILQQVPEAATSQDRLELNLQLALAYCFTRDTAQALPVLEEAAHLAQTLDDVSHAGEAALRIAHVYWLRGEAPQARRYAEQALALARQQPDPTRQAAVLRLLGRVNVAQGDFEAAVRHLRQSLQMSADAENPLNRAAANGYLAISYSHLGQKEAALAAHQEALQIAGRLESEAALAVARVQGAIACSVLEMWPEAEALAQSGLSDCQAQKLPVYAFVARSVLGRVSHYLGDDDRAQALLEEAADWARANQYLLFRHMPHVYLAEIALARGDAETVREQARISLYLARRTGNRWTKERAEEYLHRLEAMVADQG